MIEIINQERYLRLIKSFPLSLGMWDYEEEAFITHKDIKTKKLVEKEKDVEIANLVKAVQQEYGTSFDLKDLYFICYFFFNHLNAIERRKEDGLYEQRKVTMLESTKLMEVLDLMQTGGFNPKRIIIEANMMPKKISFESKEAIEHFLKGTYKREKTKAFVEFINLMQKGEYWPKKIIIELSTGAKKFSFESKEIIEHFLQGIYKVYAPFIGKGKDFVQFDRIIKEVGAENKQTYKQAKNNDRVPFIKLFLKSLHRYIKSDPVFANGASPTPNKQMQFIADLLRPAELIGYIQAPIEQVKAIRKLLTK